jgi:hypothetical protein
LEYQEILNRGHGVNAGKTMSLGQRLSRHISGLKPDSKEKGAHCDIGRTATTKKMVLFAKFPSNIRNITTILQISEQLAQLLFASKN